MCDLFVSDLVDPFAENKELIAIYVMGYIIMIISIQSHPNAHHVDSCKIIK